MCPDSSTAPHRFARVPRQTRKSLPVVAASAQALTAQPASIAPAAAPAIALDGPPAPVAPAVINRDEKGHATIRAVRIDRPLKIDGRLDEEVYASVRLNWEYQPSSQFFVVYSDGRDTVGSGIPTLLNRSFAVKITRLLRF